MDYNETLYKDWESHIDVNEARYLKGEIIQLERAKFLLDCSEYDTLNKKVGILCIFE